jgi:hypothetical protein
MEKDSKPTIPNKIKEHQRIRTVTKAEDQLHRVSILTFII